LWSCDGRSVPKDVYTTLTAIQQRDQGLVVSIVPAALDFNHSAQLANSPPMLLQKIDGDAMAELLACIYKKMKFKVEVIRKTSGSENG
jgi:hypothetical protein